MAILLHVNVDSAAQEQFYDLDARVEQYLAEAGGPPPGLMSHVVYPDGDGFVVADVWRTEVEGRSFVEDVLRPILTDAGLKLCGIAVYPVWGFGRP
jgi:hypothetical protein